MEGFIIEVNKGQYCSSWKGKAYLSTDIDEAVVYISESGAKNRSLNFYSLMKEKNLL